MYDLVRCLQNSKCIRLRPIHTQGSWAKACMCSKFAYSASLIPEWLHDRDKHWIPWFALSSACTRIFPVWMFAKGKFEEKLLIAVTLLCYPIPAQFMIGKQSFRPIIPKLWVEKPPLLSSSMSTHGCYLSRPEHIFILQLQSLISTRLLQFQW